MLLLLSPSPSPSPLGKHFPKTILEHVILRIDDPLLKAWLPIFIIRFPFLSLCWGADCQYDISTTYMYICRYMAQFIKDFLRTYQPVETDCWHLTCSLLALHRLSGKSASVTKGQTYPDTHREHNVTWSHLGDLFQENRDLALRGYMNNRSPTRK